jgi:8-oxo-dGTP pyrophosphatase MutT (NUDIX family)
VAASLMDTQTWYTSLPTMYGSAAAVITDRYNRVLLVKPNYRDHWSLPGGILEHGEAPHVGCFREVEEEIGLVLPPGPLLVVAWTAPDSERPKPIVSFLFDGGLLADASGIRLQEEELDDWRFVDPGEFGEYLPSFLLERVTAALAARSTGVPAYIAVEYRAV